MTEKRINRRNGATEDGRSDAHPIARVARSPPAQIARYWSSNSVRSPLLRFSCETVSPLCSVPCCDFSNRLWIVERAEITLRIPEVRSTNDAAHHFGAASFRQLPNELDRLGSQRLAEAIGDERLQAIDERSEERRVGTGCRYQRW